MVKPVKKMLYHMKKKTSKSPKHKSKYLNLKPVGIGRRYVTYKGERTKKVGAASLSKGLQTKADKKKICRDKLMEHCGTTNFGKPHRNRDRVRRNRPKEENKKDGGVIFKCRKLLGTGPKGYVACVNKKGKDGITGVELQNKTCPKNNPRKGIKTGKRKKKDGDHIQVIREGKKTTESKKKQKVWRDAPESKYDDEGDRKGKKITPTKKKPKVWRDHHEGKYDD